MPGDNWKAAFVTIYGHFKLLVRPFGLCNASTSFQYLINDVLCNPLDQFVVAYLDDMFIFAGNLEDFWTTQEETDLRQMKIFFLEHTNIQFLGYIISSEGLCMDPNQIKAVVEWPAPWNIKEIQWLVEFANFYREFIRDFSKLLALITDRSSFHVHSSHYLSLSKLNALNPAGAAILFQTMEDTMQLYPCTYFSCLMSEAEKNSPGMGHSACECSD